MRKVEEVAGKGIAEYEIDELVTRGYITNTRNRNRRNR